MAAPGVRAGGVGHHQETAAAEGGAGGAAGGGVVGRFGLYLGFADSLDL